MTPLTSDFEKLVKTFDLETNGTVVSATIIFQLLLLKHGRRNAFAWYDHENCFGGDDWLNCEIQSTIHNGNSIRLEELKEVAVIEQSIYRILSMIDIEDLDIMAMALAECDSEIVEKLQGYLPGKKAAMFTPKTEEDNVSKREIEEAKGQIKSILQKKIDSGEMKIEDVLATPEVEE